MPGEVQTDTKATPDTNVETVTVSEPIVKGGGESFTSFDELESVENFKERSDQQDGKIKTGTAIDDQGAFGKSVDSDGKELEVSPDAPVSKKADTETKDVVDDVGSTDTVDKDTKIYKAKAGEDEVDIRSDSVFEVKVNGATEEVNIEDLMSNYSGKTEWSARFGELDTERRTFISEKTAVEGKLKSMVEKVLGENPWDGVAEIMEAFGANPFDGKRKLQDSFKPSEEDELLTDEELEAKTVREENDYWQKKYQDSQTAATNTQTSQQMTQRVDAVLKESGLDDAGFLETYDAMKASNEFEVERITPELVGEYSYAEKIVGFVEDALEQVSPDMEAELKEEAIEDITRHMVTEKGWTEEDVLNVVKDVYQDSATKAIAEKLVGDQKATTSNDSIDPNQGPVGFDELEDDYGR